MKTSTNLHPFCPAEGALAEYHIQIRVSDASLTFESQLEEVLRAYADAVQGKTVHFRRFFLSDAANQASMLEKGLSQFPPVPTSTVQQEPLDGTRIAAWVYCTSPMDCPGGIPTHNGYSHHWTGSLVGPEGDSYVQMSGIFGQLENQLAARGLHVATHTVRTWIFVRDVDVNYAGVVAGRRDFFGRIGLTPTTHFIASTGIEGRHPEWKNKVEMDAYSVGGLQEGQIGYLYALDHLSPTYDYGVTFERGATVTYGDRRQVYISGTASIDAHGKVLYPGDAAAQAKRMLENIGALLGEAGASFGDIAMAVVYLRDPADYPGVKAVIESAYPSLQALYVHAPVCRPAWLVEMECLALTAAGNKNYPDA